MGERCLRKFLIMGYKAQPITSKAKCSPLKANQALIDGAADIAASKGFTDYGGIAKEAIESGKKSSTASTASKAVTPDVPDTDKDKDVSVDPTDVKI